MHIEHRTQATILKQVNIKIVFQTIVVSINASLRVEYAVYSRNILL